MDRLAAVVLFLEETLAVEKNRITTAAVIQAFRTSLELPWKWLKFLLGEIGVSTTAPKEVVRQAGRNSLINNVEEWLEFLDARNLISHTYNADTGERVYLIAKNLYTVVKKLLKKWKYFLSLFCNLFNKEC